MELTAYKNALVKMAPSVTRRQVPAHAHLVSKERGASVRVRLVGSVWIARTLATVVTTPRVTA